MMRDSNWIVLLNTITQWTRFLNLKSDPDASNDDCLFRRSLRKFFRDGSSDDHPESDSQYDADEAEDIEPSSPCFRLCPLYLDV